MSLIVGVLASPIQGGTLECEVRPLVRTVMYINAVRVIQAPSATQNMIQQVEFPFDGNFQGSMRLYLGPEVSESISSMDWDNDGRLIEAKLGKLAQIGVGNINVTFIYSDTAATCINIEFIGTLANQYVPLFAVQNNSFSYSSSNDFLNGYTVTSQRIYARMGLGSTWLNTTQIMPSHKVYSIVPVGYGPTSPYTIRVTLLSDGDTNDVVIPPDADGATAQGVLNACPLLKAIGGTGVIARGPSAQNAGYQISMFDAAYFTRLSISGDGGFFVDCVPSGRTVQVQTTASGENILTGVSWSY